MRKSDEKQAAKMCAFELISSSQAIYMRRIFIDKLPFSKFAYNTKVRLWIHDLFILSRGD